MIVYMITNKINGKRYIGQTVNSLKARITRHKRPGCSAIYSAGKKYGWENLEVKVLCRCDSVDQLNHREEYMIRLFNTLSPNGYNLKGGGFNKLYSQESKASMSKAHIGKKLTNEHKNKISEAVSGKNHPNYGKTLPQLSKSLKDLYSVNNHPKSGKKVSDEGRANISAAKIGDKNPMYGKSLNETQRIGLEIGRQKMKDNARMVICIETGVIFNNSSEVAVALGVKPASVRNVLCGNRPKIKGFSFEYVV